MNKVLKVALILLIVVTLVAGCSAQDEKKAASRTIKIGVLSIDDSLPFFVAEKEDLYAKYNVDVEVIPFSSAREKDIALEAGEIDGDMTDIIVAALLKKGGTDVKIISLALGATPEEGRFCILAAPNSGIETVEDLKNVPIAISNNTIINYLSDRMTENVGLSKEDIKTENIPDLKLRLEAMLEGKDVKASLLPDPLATLAEKAGAKVIIDDTKLGVNLSQSVIIFRTEVLENNSKEVQAVMQAHKEAAEKLNQNPENYYELRIEKARIPKPLATNYPKATYSPYTLPSTEMIGDVMDWMIEKGLLEKAFSYEEIVDTNFCQK